MHASLRFLMAVAVGAATAAAGPSGAVRAQDTAAGNEQLRVFVDCSYFCDMDFMRTELTWIDYMRDRADADVHVLVTRQNTGAGGSAYTLEFIGLRRFAGQGDTLSYTSRPNDASDITRRGLTRTVKLGLVPFATRTAAAQRLDVTFAAAPAAAGAEAESSATPRDPWNFWTFRVGMNGNSSGETQQASDYLSGSMTANRTTADWKINLSLNGSYNESRFEYVIDEETRQIKSVRRNYGASSLIVMSLTPHLSAGVRANASTSTFGNNTLTMSIAPAIEYNFMPYSQSTRRSLVVQYAPGVRHADYREITIYGHEEETRPIHNLSVTYATRQTWGSVNVGLNGSQYLHDRSKYNAGFGGSTDLRLFKGLSFNIGGNYSHVRDQLSLARRNLTEEEVLLRRRQLATSYNYFVYGGLSYRFGSIFNNVVNPRMGSGGGDMIIMM
jgi:hypothetical protein